MRSFRLPSADDSAYAAHLPEESLVEIPVEGKAIFVLSFVGRYIPLHEAARRMACQER